jgi:hypothetical protein
VTVNVSTETGTENEGGVPGSKFEISRTRQGDLNVTSIALSQAEKQDQSTTSIDAGIQSDFGPHAPNACSLKPCNEEFGSNVITDSDSQPAKQLAPTTANDDGR